MDRRRAKKEACYITSGLIEAFLAEGYTHARNGEWSDEDVERIEDGLRELARELLRRSALAENEQ